MLFSYLTSFLLGLFLFSSAADTETDENLQVKFVNDRFQSSSSVMCAKLKRADLENIGFQKEIITKDVQEAGSNKSNFQTVYFYYKLGECSYESMKKIGKELNSSLPGVIGQQMPIKVREEIKFRHLNNAGRCKMGLEVYFPEDLGCDVRREKRDESYIRRGWRTRRTRVRIGISIRVRIRARIKIGRSKNRK